MCSTNRRSLTIQNKFVKDQLLWNGSFEKSASSHMPNSHWIRSSILFCARAAPHIRPHCGVCVPCSSARCVSKQQQRHQHIRHMNICMRALSAHSYERRWTVPHNIRHSYNMYMWFCVCDIYLHTMNTHACETGWLSPLGWSVPCDPRRCRCCVDVAIATSTLRCELLLG